MIVVDDLSSEQIVRFVEVKIRSGVFRGPRGKDWCRCCVRHAIFVKTVPHDVGNVLDEHSVLDSMLLQTLRRYRIRSSRKGRSDTM
jgi:hypothetical protein